MEKIKHIEDIKPNDFVYVVKGDFLLTTKTTNLVTEVRVIDYHQYNGCFSFKTSLCEGSAYVYYKKDDDDKMVAIDVNDWFDNKRHYWKYFANKKSALEYVRRELAEHIRLSQDKKKLIEVLLDLKKY